MRFFSQVGRFFKKNVFYIVLALCIIGIALGVTFACIEGTKPRLPVDADNSGSGNVGEDDPPLPVVKEIIFCLPVENGSVLKDYSADKLVASTTLPYMTTHMGIDYTGAEGASVVAVYDGKVESIETGLLEGTVITIDHGNGLKTVYKSLLDGESVTVGKAVKQGDKIGVISTSQREEYKDGAHVHFEVYENGAIIDPMKYLSAEEK